MPLSHQAHDRIRSKARFRVDADGKRAGGLAAIRLRGADEQGCDRRKMRGHAHRDVCNAARVRSTYACEGGPEGRRALEADPASGELPDLSLAAIGDRFERRFSGPNLHDRVMGVLNDRMEQLAVIPGLVQ